MTHSATLSQFEAAGVLVRYAFSGALGSTEGMAVHYASMRTTDNSFTFSVTLEPSNHRPSHLDSGEPSAPESIEFTDEDAQKAVVAATGDAVASSSLLTNGDFSVAYKVLAEPKLAVPYVVRLRSHGSVASTDALMRYVRANSEPGALPMPAVYSIPGEAERQRATGPGRQITQFVPGVTAERVYVDMAHAERLELVRKMALAWQACWGLPLPSPRSIGELVATDSDGSISLSVGADRHCGLGGPFASVREWLRARLRDVLGSLQRRGGDDEFKEEFGGSIRALVGCAPVRIPAAVEQCPIMALHVDMGLDNVLVAEGNHAEIKAIMDWELCASAPFLAAHRSVDTLFRERAANGRDGDEYPRADRLRAAFWDASPRWKALWESQAAKELMEWMRLVELMKPEPSSREMPRAEKWEFWAENRRVVEGMLDKYGEGKR